MTEQIKILKLIRDDPDFTDIRTRIETEQARLRKIKRRHTTR